MPVRNFVSDSGNLNSYFGVPDGPSFGVYLRDIGFHKTSPCHNFGPAVRDYWLIHVIKSGKGWFMKSGVKTTLSAGVSSACSSSVRFMNSAMHDEDCAVRCAW